MQDVLKLLRNFINEQASLTRLVVVSERCFLLFYLIEVFGILWFFCPNKICYAQFNWLVVILLFECMRKLGLVPILFDLCAQLINVWYWLSLGWCKACLSDWYIKIINPFWWSQQVNYALLMDCLKFKCILFLNCLITKCLLSHCFVVMILHLLMLTRGPIKNILNFYSS